MSLLVISVVSPKEHPNEGALFMKKGHRSDLYALYPATVVIQVTSALVAWCMLLKLWCYL